MGPTVNPIDDEVPPVIELIGEAFSATRPTIGAPGLAGSTILKSRCSLENARCMVRMMSPRSPIARRTGSACGLTFQTLVDDSSASPIR